MYFPGRAVKETQRKAANFKLWVGSSLFGNASTQVHLSSSCLLLFDDYPEITFYVGMRKFLNSLGQLYVKLHILTNVLFHWRNKEHFFPNIGFLILPGYKFLVLLPNPLSSDARCWILLGSSPLAEKSCSVCNEACLYLTSPLLSTCWATDLIWQAIANSFEVNDTKPLTILTVFTAPPLELCFLVLVSSCNMYSSDCVLLRC